MADFKIEDCSPQVQRLLQLAQIEAGAGRNGRGDRVCMEHLLVAMAQCGEGECGDLMTNCGLTVHDVRSGNFKPKPILATA
jgi:hypothetical protein